MEIDEIIEQLINQLNDIRLTHEMASDSRWNLIKLVDTLGYSIEWEHIEKRRNSS